MCDLAVLGKALDALPEKAGRAEKVMDSLAASCAQNSRSFAKMADDIENSMRKLVELQRLQQAAGASAAPMGREFAQAGASMRQLDAQVVAYQQHVAGLKAANDATATSMRNASQAGVGLFQQLTAIGVSAATGTKPLTILAEQGPKIVEQLMTMSREGVTLGAAFGAMGKDLTGAVRMLGPLAPAAAAIGVVAAGAFGAAALAARALNKENGDLTAGLGLTEAQFKQLKEKGVDTGVTIGDVFTGTWNMIVGGVSKALAPVAGFFGQMLDKITTGAVKFIKVYIGLYVGAFEAVRATWKLLPGALGDLAISAAQAVVDGTTKMINNVIEKVNTLRPTLNLALKILGMPLVLDELKKVTPLTLENPWAGQAAATTAVAQEAYRRGRASVNGGDWGNAIMDANGERVHKEADRLGEAKEAAAAPCPICDERAAAVPRQPGQTQAAQTQADQAQADRDRATAEKRRKTEQEITKQELEARLGRLDNERKLMESQASLVRSSFARTVLERDILKKRQEAEVVREQGEVDRLRGEGASQKSIDVAEDRLATLKKVQASELELAERQITLGRAVQDATSSVRDFKDAFRSQDWDRVFDNFVRTIETIQASFAQFGLSGGLATAGGALGSLIGGKAGRALSMGSSIAGMGGALGALGGFLSGGMGIGAAASPAAILAGATADLGAGATGIMGALGNLGGALSSVASVLGPVALVAGVGYALYEVFKKPSNKGAGYDLTTGEFSGKSRNAETEGAVKQAGDAILQAQDMLKSFGLDLKTTINGLTIGSRDQSQITTSDGRTLYSAKGDPEAAVEAALAAVLDGADYVSDTQKKLVESMRAAGKGFDEIATSLQAWKAAQEMITAVNDEILRLTDPQAYDLQNVKRVSEAQLKAAQAAYDAGYITTDQLTELNAALARLNGLQIDEVVKRYGGDEIANLTDQLRTAYEAEAGALREHAEEYRRIADSLKAYGDQIRGALVSTFSPSQQLGLASRRFQSVASLAAQGDKGGLEQFQGAAEAFRQASAQFSPDAATNRRNLAAIQRATQDAYDAAKAQVDFAEQQLAVLQNQVAPFLNDIKTNTLSTVELLKLLVAKQAAGRSGVADPIQAAVEALAASGPTAGANDPFNAGAYLAQNPDVAASGMDPYEHYIRTGQYEIAGGYRERGFATGGSFRVGGSGGEDSQFMPLWLTPGEMVDVRRPGQGGSNDNGRTAVALERQNQLIAEQNNLLRENTRQAKKTADLLTRVTRDGESLVTVAA